MILLMLRSLRSGIVFLLINWIASVEVRSFSSMIRNLSLGKRIWDRNGTEFWSIRTSLTMNLSRLGNSNYENFFQKPHCRSSLPMSQHIYWVWDCTFIGCSLDAIVSADFLPKWMYLRHWGPWSGKGRETVGIPHFHYGTGSCRSNLNLAVGWSSGGRVVGSPSGWGNFLNREIDTRKGEVAKGDLHGLQLWKGFILEGAEVQAKLLEPWKKGVIEEHLGCFLSQNAVCDHQALQTRDIHLQKSLNSLLRKHNIPQL